LPCRIETDSVRDLVVVRADGDLTLDVILSAIVEVMQHPAFQQRPAVLWDVRGARVESLRGADLRELLRQERKGRSYRQARMAFLASDDVGFGTARMVDGMAAADPIEVRVFRHDEDAAWDWLTGGEGAPESSGGTD